MNNNDDNNPVTVRERSNANFNLIQILLPDNEGKLVNSDGNPLRNVGSDLARELSNSLIHVHDSAVSDFTLSTTIDEGGEYRTLLESMQNLAGEMSRRLERLATVVLPSSVERGKGEEG